MELKNGSVVISRAGRDKGSLLAVVEIGQGHILVCDGGERPLEKPKRKNPKHLAHTNTVLTPEMMATNRSLKKSLRVLGGTYVETGHD